MNSGQIKSELLTPTARLIVNAIGLPAAIQLFSQRGGVKLKIPARGEHSPLLASLIGAEASKALIKALQEQQKRADQSGHHEPADYVAGDYLLVPKLDQVARQLRDREIVGAKGSVTQAQLALRNKLTVRRVQQIFDQATDTGCPSPQGQLFGE